MAPLFALVAGTLIARLVGFAGVDALDTWWTAVRVGLTVMFLLTGFAHFAQPRRAGLIAMVPPRLPRAGLLVTITGVLELLGAVGLLVPFTARLAAGCLALLMLLMLPANISAARRGMPVTPLRLRIPLQVVFLAAALFVAFSDAAF
jgi:uncharacterized membrane protein